MNLLGIRTLFVKRSGRYDLVVDTVNFADNGADFFIQGGQKWLERQGDFKGQKGRLFRKMLSGSYYTTFSNMRTIDCVTVIDSVNGRMPLEYVTYDELVSLYPTAFGSTDLGTPIVWAPLCIRGVNMDSDPLFDGQADYMDIVVDSDTYNAIVLMPPTNETISLEIFGKFGSKKLVNDGDKNWWTINEESILLKAALRELEVFYRNTQGVNDWTISIMQDMYGLEKDLVEEETNFITKLEG